MAGIVESDEDSNAKEENIEVLCRLDDEDKKEHKHDVEEHNLEDMALAIAPAAAIRRQRRLGLKTKFKESPYALRRHVFEISDGDDIKQCINKYVQRLRRGVSILSARGRVYNVQLRNGNKLDKEEIFWGTYEIVSLSGTFLPDQEPTDFTIFIYDGGDSDTMVGGYVDDSLLAHGQVKVIAAIFATPLHAIAKSLPNVTAEERSEVNNRAKSTTASQSHGTLTAKLRGINIFRRCML